MDGKSDPPVCKLMDFSKERFKEKRYEKEMRKKQVVSTSSSLAQNLMLVQEAACAYVVWFA